VLLHLVYAVAMPTCAEMWSSLVSSLAIAVGARLHVGQYLEVGVDLGLEVGDGLDRPSRSCS